MAKTLDAGTNLFSAAHPHISKHTSVFSIMVSSSIVLAGVACVALSLDLDESSTTGSMILLTVGTILVLFALYRFFWKCTETVYVPTGSPINEGSYYFDSADLQTLQKVLIDKDFGRLGVSFKRNGNGRIDYMVSKDGKFMAVQLFQFVPYLYEPFTEIYYYTDADAQAFRHCLETQTK